MNKNVITLEEFLKIEQMLKSTPDDFDLALETIKNLECTKIIVTLFGKELMHNKRKLFTDYFKDNVGMTLNLESWNKLFETIKPYCSTQEEKEIVEYLVNRDLGDIVKNHHEFIKEVKLEIKW